MHMIMVVIAGRSRLARIIGADLQAIVGMVIAVLVTVMPEMCSLARRVFQDVTNAHRCRVDGIQREHDCKKKNEAGAHGEKAYLNISL